MGRNLAGLGMERAETNMSERFADPSRLDYIVDSLAYVDGTLPFEAVHEARANWPELREQFLAELVQAVADPERAMDEDSALPIYAMFLAAETRDAAFAPALFELLNLSADLIAVWSNSLEAKVRQCKTLSSRQRPGSKSRYRNLMHKLEPGLRRGARPFRL